MIQFKISFFFLILYIKFGPLLSNYFFLLLLLLLKYVCLLVGEKPLSLNRETYRILQFVYSLIVIILVRMGSFVTVIWINGMCN